MGEGLVAPSPISFPPPKHPYQWGVWCCPPNTPEHPYGWGSLWGTPPTPPSIPMGRGGW